MSELERIADLLRREAREHMAVPPRDRQEALLAVLRRELDAIPARDVFTVLAELREACAPGGDGETEAGSLWEAVANLAGVPPADEPRPQAAPPPPAAAAPLPAAGSTAGPSPGTTARAVLGEHLPPGGDLPSGADERLLRALDLLVGLVEMYEEQVRLLSAEIRRGTMLAGRSGGTIAGLKRGERLRKLLARIVLEGADPAELQHRMKAFGSTPILVYGAHHASVKRATDSIRKLIDPGTLQKAHGRGAWEAYRRVFHNELHDLDPSFQAQFVDEPFIQEYFKEFDKL